MKQITGIPYPVRRVTLFCGHYGSGKTNIAVSFARALHRAGSPTVIADLDIVNPYFRTADSEDELRAEGISVISLPFARSNVDLPSIPSEAYSLVQDRSKLAVLDIGGDDRGAYALGRFVPYLREENDFDMLFVANFYRPLTQNVPDALDVFNEIETACGLRFTGIVNNSNLGAETTAEDVLATAERAQALAERTGLPLLFTSADERTAQALGGRLPAVFPMKLQARPVD